MMTTIVTIIKYKISSVSIAKVYLNDILTSIYLTNKDLSYRLKRDNIFIAIARSPKYLVLILKTGIWHS